MSPSSITEEATAVSWGIWTPPGEWAGFARHEGLGDNATEEIHEATAGGGGVRGRARRRNTGSYDTVDCTPDLGCWASGEQGRVARLER